MWIRNVSTYSMKVLYVYNISSLKKISSNSRLNSSTNWAQRQLGTPFICYILIQTTAKWVNNQLDTSISRPEVLLISKNCVQFQLGIDTFLGTRPIGYI